MLQQGLTLHQQGKIADAEEIYKSVLKQQPKQFDALHLLGVIALRKQNTQEGVDLIKQAIAINQQHPDAYYNLGNGLHDLGRHEEAIANYDKMIALKPDFAEAHYNRGNALRELRRGDDAVASYSSAIALKPDYAEAYFNRGNTLREMKRHKEAIENYKEAVSIKPGYAEAHYNLGNGLSDTNRPAEALDCYRAALAVNPGHKSALSAAGQAARRICDWSSFDDDRDRLLQRLDNEGEGIKPFSFLSVCDDPERQLQCARGYIRPKLAGTPWAVLGDPPRESERIHIAYLSADLHAHATAYLMAELFELHDRGRFEVSAFSYGEDDGSPMRQRLKAAFENFHDVRDKTDREIAEMIADHQVHIAVDLKGYTKDERPEILAWRPAPVQVNYLGLPATMGADFIDYILVDPFVVPSDQQAYFTERLVHLPDCYMVNDSKREIAEQTMSRGEAGLPKGSFVFCCFNNTYKITPAFFDIWMRLLTAVPDSVLWLLGDNDSAARNLRREAANRGVEPARLVFAPRCDLADHLARHRLADLILDTLPYNAHTTASDALWAGLPVLTCHGKSFAARVAGSLLHAIGLAELVTDNLPDYEALALKLARDRGQLAAVRDKLLANRQTSPLFDTARFRGHIEAAYTEMHDRWRAGAEPEAFAVAASAPSA